MIDVVPGSSELFGGAGFEAIEGLGWGWTTGSGRGSTGRSGGASTGGSGGVERTSGTRLTSGRGSGGCWGREAASEGPCKFPSLGTSKNGMSGRSARSVAKDRFWAMPGRSGRTSGSSKSGVSPSSCGCKDNSKDQINHPSIGTVGQTMMNLNNMLYIVNHSGWLN